LDIRKTKWWENRENYIMRNFITCTLHLILLQVIISWGMRWMGHVACAGEMRYAYRILVENLKGRPHLEDLGIDGMVVLKRIIME
jgi:hypothetical protein